VDETGKLDIAALKAFLEAEEKANDAKLNGPTLYDREMAVFVARRVEEAQVAQALHVFPDDIPWNRQPWWKMAIWNAYWQGDAKGLRSKYG